ncbi:activated Cdc42 kinase-like isoform X3 [Pectinophora gossypiella]|uniref:activated Cdc42 kinase-like isoform X3 n=1 Tax=Pectinophora gossypiella TaxID=13191 RepID=UPI00214F5141|nr:activated Cdc42 kinase-like isoform X3 [Pectinophora gossypiella]
MESIVDDRESLKDFLEEAELQQYYELFRDILKVTKVSQLKFVATEDLVQIGLSKPEQRRYKKIYTKYFPNPYISKIKKLLSSNKKNEAFPHGHTSLPIEFQPFTENSVKVPTKHIISIEDITINKELGMGQFGVVQQGTWTTGNQRLQVAIKCLGHERMTSNSTEFLKEAAVMHSIEHPNIVRLYGVVLHLDSLMLVTELAPLRSLLECLREVSLRTNFPVPNLCEFAEQICDGMTYLENKRLIHRDLAARNILVFSKDRVKISDFGLSRALGVGKDYYQTNYNVNLKLPVAWCAPECILYLRFTSASDVWAFGVCLWEMFTYGFQPWAAFSGQQILEAIDAPNYQRLERPECCPEAYYTTMLECWSHDPNDRPKFKDLSPKLRELRPEQVQTTADFQKLEDGRRTNFLEYKSGQIITVLGKENMTKSSMWYGVLPGGACGMFDPNVTKPYIKPDKSVYQLSGSLSPHASRRSARAPRSSLLRSDVKRHTYTGKRTIQRSMISSPQGDVKHTGHVGLDGAYFGDISFLDPAGCPPRQVVTPYKPSEDLEQVPLINPNSPSHLTGACTTPYPLLNPRDAKTDCDEVDLSYPETRTRSLKKLSHRLTSEPTTSKSLLNKVKCATLGRSHKTDNGHGTVSKTDEVHEYHEISDTDTENTPNEHARAEHFAIPDSPGIPKSYGDFSQSLLDEIESMFRSLDGRRRDEAGTSGKSIENDNAMRSQTLTKNERKKGYHTGTMKLMSVHDEKTLETAVAMANEITTKSMNDLESDNKLPNSPSERTKFHFKFPLVSLHHGAPHDAEKDATGKHERRNFSEEANSVPDIQSTITEESKLAYTSLIEQPTPSSSLISQIATSATGMHKPSTIPKPAPRTNDARAHFHSLQKQLSYKYRSTNEANDEGNHEDSKNELPLPPKSTKPKLIDKPRHIRKYPLKLSNNFTATNNETQNLQSARPIIYQNTITCPIIKGHHQNGRENKILIQDEKNGVDVYDGPEPAKVDTNPFKNISGPSSANPFNCYLEPVDCEDDTPATDTAEGDEQTFKEGTLVKDFTDHVSVEDLLEFADQKPCGRQRGVESDEVRIMSKVLKQQVTPEECLEALELSDWNVHHAIKVMRVKISVASDVALDACHRELLNSKGDVVKASALLVLCKQPQ